MSRPAGRAEGGQGRLAVPLLAVVAVAGPLVMHAVAPDLGGWAGLLVAWMAFTVGFLVAPIRTVAAFAAYMLFIETIAGSADARIRTLDELFVPTMVVLSMLTRHRPVRAWVHWARDGAVVVLILAATASSLANGVAPTTWTPQMLLLLKGIAVFYVVLAHDVTDADVSWILRAWLAVALTVLAIGALQVVKALLPGTEPFAARAGLPVVSSVFYHPELFGWLCSVAALFLIAHHVVYRRLWMLVLAILFSVGTITSGRRKSILATVAGVAAGAATEFVRGQGRTSRLRVWIPSAVGIAVLTVAFLPVLSGLYALTIEGYVNPVTGSRGVDGPAGATAPPGEGQEAGRPDRVAGAATPARIALYLGAVAVAADEFPLGAGLGRYGSWISRTNYSDVYREYGLDQIYGLSPENPQFITDTFWPQILGETGVVGLGAYVVFIGWIGVELLRLIRRDLVPAQRAVVLGAGMLFAAAMVELLASPILGSPSQVYLLMLAFAGTFSWVAGGLQNGGPVTTGPTAAPAAR